MGRIRDAEGLAEREMKAPFLYHASSLDQRHAKSRKAVMKVPERIPEVRRKL
jgi:hypothetical protein